MFICTSKNVYIVTFRWNGILTLCGSKVMDIYLMRQDAEQISAEPLAGRLYFWVTHLKFIQSIRSIILHWMGSKNQWNLLIQCGANVNFDVLSTHPGVFFVVFPSNLLYIKWMMILYLAEFRKYIKNAHPMRRTCV